MSIFKCDKCGSAIEIEEGAAEAECGSCGAKQAVPKACDQPDDAHDHAIISPSLKRAFLFLEDGNWEDADEYCEKVLDQEPENGMAYLGKLMAEIHVKRQDNLKDCEEPFDSNSNYHKAVRFGGEKLASELEGCIAHIKERNEAKRVSDIYNNAVKAMQDAKTQADFKKAAAIFQTIPGVEDADSLAEKCLEEAEISRKNAIYSAAKANMSGSDIAKYEKAIKIFESIAGWKDAEAQISACHKKIEEIKQKEEADKLERERRAKEDRLKAEENARKLSKFLRTAVIVIVSVGLIAGLSYGIMMKLKYNKAMALIDSGNYDAAYALLEEMDRKDAITQNKYDRAMKLIESGDYEEAYVLLDGLNFNDSEKKLEEILPKCKRILLSKAEVGSIIEFGSYEQDNNNSNGKEPIEWIVLDKGNDNIFVVSKYGLDSKPYNTEYEDVTWETCTLRKWLNESFLNEAFSAEEQGWIKSSVVTADANPEYDTPPGNDTNDKVFCLSILEAQKYFSSDESRKCQATSYAKSRGVWNYDSGYCLFWLRSPGDYASSAAYVDLYGDVTDFGCGVCNDSNAVRPALRISIDSSFASSSGGSASSSVSSSASGKVLTAADCREGSYVTFGSYPQNNGDTPEPIEWLVLENDGESALLLSKYGLDCQPFNAEPDVTWETCTLRKWLNESFLNEAFSAEEQGMIKTSVVTADANPEFDTPPGNDTNDKVFCLSIPEAQKYFSSDESRKCQPTAYAVSRKAYRDSDTGCCGFWLRSPGFCELHGISAADCAAGVNRYGTVDSTGAHVFLDSWAVRPALRIIL